MKEKVQAKVVSLITVFFTLVLFSVAHAGACPDKKTMQKAIQDTFRRPGITVKAISPSPAEGICQVMVEFNGQKKILYSDKTGIFLITGQIFNTKTKRNITQEAITELNRFSKADMKRLDELVAFSLGEKGPVVYLVTDPQCPYCKKAEEILFPMAKKGEITLKVLLFPLPFHKGAKEESISIICDKKGAEGLKNRYRSENQCEAGKKKIEDTIAYLRTKGITGTPTHIFSDGRFQSGVMNKDAVLSKASAAK